MPGLTDDAKRRIWNILEGKESLGVLTSPEELHHVILNYNWDDSEGLIEEAAVSPILDRGTALAIYFLSGPIVCYYADKSDCADYDRKLFECISTLEERILKDQFDFRSIYLDPKKLWGDGGDYTRNPDFVKSPPAALCVASPGNVVPEVDLSYELTEEEKRELGEEDDRLLIESQEKHERMANQPRESEEDCEKRYVLDYRRIVETAPEFRGNLETFEKYFLKKYGYLP